MEFRIRKMEDTDAIAVCRLAKQLNYNLDTGQFLEGYLKMKTSHAFIKELVT